jgi:hypothetical protein
LRSSRRMPRIGRRVRWRPVRGIRQTAHTQPHNRSIACDFFIVETVWLADARTRTGDPSLRALIRCRGRSGVVAGSRAAPRNPRGGGGGRRPRKTRAWTPRGPRAWDCPERSACAHLSPSSPVDHHSTERSGSPFQPTTLCDGSRFNRRGAVSVSRASQEHTQAPRRTSNDRER